MQRNKKDCELLKDGRYVYYIHNADGTETPVYLTEGEDGVTDVWIQTLAEFDSEEHLSNRYYSENQDLYFERLKMQAETGILEIDDPVTQIPEKVIRKLPIHMDSIINQVYEVVRSLPDNKQNLIWSICGELKKIAVVAREENERLGVTKTRQAYDKQYRHLLVKIEKLLAEIGINHDSF